jgi:hypothetical protein
LIGSRPWRSGRDPSQTPQSEKVSIYIVKHLYLTKLKHYIVVGARKKSRKDENHPGAEVEIHHMSWYDGPLTPRIETYNDDRDY